MTGFFVTVLAVYGLLNFYVIRRGWQAMAGARTGRWVYLTVALFLVLSFPISRITARLLPQMPTTFLSYVGAFFMAAVIYAFFFALIIDLFRLLNALLHFFPRCITENPQRAAFVAMQAVLVAVFLILAGGFIAAVYPRLRTLDLTVDKKAGTMDRLNVVMISDVHLSSIYRNSHLRKIVDRINRLKPDLVLLPGDIVDMDVSQAEESKMIVTLREIRAPLGVFAVTGNHEYYGGVTKNVEYLRKAGVRVLQDEFVKIDEAFYLVGRKDLSAARFGDARKPLDQIMEGVDKSLPVILMDHEPFHLEEAEHNGVDLQVSGHTHAGQLFPISLINKAMYEQNWGYWRRGRTQYYVSCGVGTWGMPIRTAGISEIVQIKITFR